MHNLSNASMFILEAALYLDVNAADTIEKFSLLQNWEEIECRSIGKELILYTKDMNRR